MSRSDAESSSWSIPPFYWFVDLIWIESRDFQINIVVSAGWLFPIDFDIEDTCLTTSPLLHDRLNPIPITELLITYKIMAYYLCLEYLEAVKIAKNFGFETFVNGRAQKTLDAERNFIQTELMFEVIS